jgi:hypothetical protein
MSTLIINAEDNKIEKIKEYLTSIRVQFVSTDEVYDPAFVAKLQRSRKQAEDGKTIRVKADDLWK